MNKASITLTKYTADYEFDPDQRKGWAIMVRAEGSGIDPEIFVYHKMPDNDPYQGDLFEAVASINQYYEIPSYDVVSTAEGELIPYYRRNQMEVFARSPAELDEIWEYLQIDVARLVADFNSTNILIEMTQSKVTDSGGIESIVSEGSTVVQLEWQPAGSWDGTNIVNPDLTKAGWLPVDLFPNSFSSPSEMVPAKAKWYYNVAADADFKTVFDEIKTPYNQNLLDINGVYLLYGEHGAYQITKDTVYWMENVNYQTELISKHPWPDDYIDGITPSVEPVIRLGLPLVVPA